MFKFYILSVVFCLLCISLFMRFLKISINRDDKNSKTVALRLGEILNPNDKPIFVYAFIPFFNIGLSLVLVLAIAFPGSFYEFLSTLED